MTSYFFLSSGLRVVGGPLSVTVISPDTGFFGEWFADTVPFLAAAAAVVALGAGLGGAATPAAPDPFRM